jgi:hypothetical protein
MWGVLKRFFDEGSQYRRNIEAALALNRRGEVRRDGLRLRSAINSLAIEWVARDIHPWDRGLSPAAKATLFVEQCLSDTEAAVYRLFDRLPSIDLIEVRVLDPSCEYTIIGGSVLRTGLNKSKVVSPAMRIKLLGLNYRLLGCHFEALDHHPDPNGTGRPISKASFHETDALLPHAHQLN